MTDMEVNMAYGCVERSEAVTESNVYDMPELNSKPKKIGSLQVKEESGESKKKVHRFNIFITIFAVIILLFTLVFTIFFLINYFSNQAYNDLQNKEIKALQSLLNYSNEKLRIQLEQQLNTTYISLEEQIQDLVTTGGLMKVANLDMRDPTQQCPDGFKLITRTEPPLRTCGRPDRLIGCVSSSFPVNGAEYCRVCGRIVGYQIGSPSGFGTGSSSIDSHYMAGISLTHGSPRQHIWSLVNARGEGFTGEVCPCIQGSTNNAPSFVGNDYFCDSAIRDTNATNGVFYPGDPLWDGQGCGSTTTCCELNNPPWFCKQLPQPTTEDIEMRLCENSSPSDDDSPFEVLELYIN